MPYLNLDLDYFDNPKTRRLVGLLGRGAELLPLRLWNYCGRYFAETGRVTGHATSEIESICGWWGQSGEAVSAMIKVGFLEKDGDDYIAHDWLEHQGHIAVFKQRAKQAARTRWDSYKNATSIPTSTANGNARAGPEQSSLPYHALPTKEHTHTARAREGVETSEKHPELPVELPRGFPKTEAEAIAQSMTVGVSDEFVIEAWNKAMSRGGKDAKQVPIDSFRHYVALEKKWAANREAETKHNGNNRGKHQQTVSEIRNSHISGYNGNIDRTPNRLPPAVAEKIRLKELAGEIPRLGSERS